MYPSDLTDVQWLQLEPLLQRERSGRHGGGRPRKYELRRIVDAMLYVVKLIGWAREMFGYDVEVVKRNQLHTFQVLPKRWIVERTLAWLGWSRRLGKDYELRHDSAETMIHIAFAHMLLRRYT